MPTQTPLPAQFGRYHILEKVGEGGMGAVYLAEDTQLGRRVALKVPHFTATENPKVIERFYREARAAAAIEHPNLCSVHDVGQIDGVHYLTMPFIEGTSLADRIDPERPWPPRQAAELVRQLATALEVLHQRGLVHRDLKPTNILLRPSGEPVIMDFGLARSFTEDSQRLTATGLAVGTPAYMSPEQIAGARGQIGPATDVYSLGVLLYELVTGSVPFLGPLAVVYGQILHGAAPAPSTLRPELGNSVDPLCLKALAKNPEDRYASMAAFAAALQEFLGREEVRPLPPPLPTGTVASTGLVVRTCPACGRTLQVPQAMQGQRVKCPGCQTSLAVAGARDAITQQPKPRAASTAPAARGESGRRRGQKSKAGLVVACVLAMLALVGGIVGYFTLSRADSPGEPPVAAAKYVSHPQGPGHKATGKPKAGTKENPKEDPEKGNPGKRRPDSKPGEKVKPTAKDPPETKVRPTLPPPLVGPPEPKKTTTPPPPPPPPLDAAGKKAEAALKPLRERLGMGGAVPDALRQKLYAFRFTHPGTPAAFEAARLLSSLPSPLDQLDPERIPAAERFPWQPDKLIAVLGEHRGRHGGYVQCVLCSNDGKTVVSGGIGLTRIWDAATLILRSTLPYEGGAVLSLALSRDGNTLVVGGKLGEAAGSAQVWNVKDKLLPRLRFTIPAPGTPVRAVALHPDGKTLAVGCLDGSLRLHDVSGEVSKLLNRFEANTGGVLALAYTPDGSQLASGGLDKKVRLWGMEDSKARLRAALDGGGTVMSLAISPDGTKLASGGDELSLRVWPLPAKGKLRPRILKMKEGWVTALSFSRTGKRLAAAANGRPNAHGTVELWTLGPVDKRSGSLKGHLSFVFGVAFAPDGKTLFSGANDWTVRAWDVTKLRPVERFKPWGHLSLVRAAAFSPDGKSLISGGEDNTVRLWDLTRAPLKSRILVPEGATPVPNAIHAVAWSPDGLVMAAGDAKGLVRQWDAAGRIRQALRPHPAAVDALAYLPDGQRLLAASDRVLILWDAKQGRELRRFKGHETPIHGMALSPDGHRALTGGGAPFLVNKPPYTDATMRLWDVDEGKELQLVKSPTPLASVAFAADGRHAFSGALEIKVRRWDLSGPHAVEEKALPGETPFAFRLQPTPDGRRLVAFGLDGKLIVWDLTTGERLWHWQFPEMVGDVALSPEGRHAAVTLSNGVIYVLRLAEREADKEKDS